MSSTPEQRSDLRQEASADGANQLIQTWKEAWKQQRFRVESIATLVVLAVLLGLFVEFLEFVEQRQGVVFNDPLLTCFDPIDLTKITFFILYSSLLMAIVVVVHAPIRLIVGMQSYALMLVFRMSAMYLIPLDPPPTIIPLQDPFVGLFGSTQAYTHDLFFSGHTSTMFLLYLSVWNRWLRLILFVGMMAVGVCMVLQHAHYTVDVLIAPFVMYGCYRIAVLFREHELQTHP